MQRFTYEVTIYYRYMVDWQKGWKRAHVTLHGRKRVPTPNQSHRLATGHCYHNNADLMVTKVVQATTIEYIEA